MLRYITDVHVMQKEKHAKSTAACQNMNWNPKLRICMLHNQIMPCVLTYPYVFLDFAGEDWRSLDRSLILPVGSMIIREALMHMLAMWWCGYADVLIIMRVQLTPKSRSVDTAIEVVESLSSWMPITGSGLHTLLLLHIIRSLTLYIGHISPWDDYLGVMLCKFCRVYCKNNSWFLITKYQQRTLVIIVQTCRMQTSSVVGISGVEIVWCFVGLMAGCVG